MKLPVLAWVNIDSGYHTTYFFNNKNEFLYYLVIENEMSESEAEEFYEEIINEDDPLSNGVLIEFTFEVAISDNKVVATNTPVIINSDC